MNEAKEKQQHGLSYEDRTGLQEKGVEDDRPVSMRAHDVSDDEEKKASAMEPSQEMAKSPELTKDSYATLKEWVDDKEMLLILLKEESKWEEWADYKSTMSESVSSSSRGSPPAKPNHPQGADPYASRVGTQAAVGPDMEGLSLRDLEAGTIFVGGVRAEPEAFDDNLEEEIREEIQAEIRDKLHQAQIATAEEIDPEEVVPKREKRPLCTKRCALIAAFIVALGIYGLVVGLLFGRDSPEEGPSTVTGINGGDGFGDFIILSNDGKTLAAASDKDSYAMVFRRNDGSKEWNQIGQTLFGDGQFGRVMDFNRDGGMLIVGSWSNDEVAEKAGKAQVFGFNGTGWDPIGQELFGDASQDRFGYFVAMSDSGDRIAVSARNADPSEDQVDAGIVRIYGRNSTGYWTQMGQKLQGEFPGEQFGECIAMNANGTRLAVSALRWAEKRGRIRTFDFQGGAWVENIKQLEGIQLEGWWGSAMSMTPDGKLLAVGSDGADDGGDDSGFVGVYQLDSDTWKLRGNAIAGPGEQVRLGIRGVPMSDDGNCLAAGGSHFQNRTGVGYLFQWKNETWRKVVEVVGYAPGDHFGGSSTLSGDCKWVAWGANQKETAEEASGYVEVYAVDDLV